MTGMQKKTIDEYITKRLQSWVESIKNPLALSHVLQGISYDKYDETIKDFQQEIIDNVLVSGGCIASMLLGEDVNDIDVYFMSKSVAKKVAQYYVNEMIDKGNLKTTEKVPSVRIVDNNTNGVAIFIKSMGVVGEQISTNNYDYFEMQSENAVDEFFATYKESVRSNKDDKSHTLSFMSSNAITLKSDIQLILRFCGDAEHIHKNFDFIHATNYWTKTSGIVYNQKALQSLLERRLYYVGSLFPVASIFRLRKFIQRGYRISAGEMCKIAYDVSKLNLDDPFVLQEQLMGCDVAYFGEVLRILSKDQDKDIDRTYLFTLIDQVFQEEGIR